ncbi:MAG: hypothetical protein ACYCPW_10745 [Nitrososphaerales archaeon]
MATNRKTVKVTLDVPIEVDEFFKENCLDPVQDYYQVSFLTVLQGDLSGFYDSPRSQILSELLDEITTFLSSKSNGYLLPMIEPQSRPDVDRFRH